MKAVKFLIVCVVSNILFSCVPTSVMRMRPIEQESIFDGGKEIVKQEKNGVKIVASYDGRYKEYSVLDVEVFNNTDQPLTVSPKDFSFFPLDENRQNLRSRDGQYVYSFSGIEPAEQINYVHHEMARQEAKIKRTRVVNTVLIVGGIVALIASSGRRSEGAWQTARAAETVVQVAQVKRVIDHTNYYSRMEALDREGKIWSQENFRTTTLAPHTSMRGGVFLETNPQAKFVELKYLYSSDKEPFSFLFEQWIESRR
ncbi:MAG: hypothetical protein U5N85_03325 [Arcicella sp.]|nr:hypothetical protein [Arcicella sp.]